MESFIDKGYTLSTLTVLNDVRIYMKVIVLSDMLTERGNKMAQWALRGEANMHHKWVWPQRRIPTSQNLKVWRDCLRGTFMKGIDDVLRPLHGIIAPPQFTITHPLFLYNTMIRLSLLQAILLQYPPELISLLGHYPVTDMAGRIIMTHLGLNTASAGSDGSVKDGIGGHSFCIATHTFSHHIWGQACTVGHTKDMSSLRAEHAGALGVLLLLYGMHVFSLICQCLMNSLYT